MQLTHFLCFIHAVDCLFSKLVFVVDSIIIVSFCLFFENRKTYKRTFTVTCKSSCSTHSEGPKRVSWSIRSCCTAPELYHHRRFLGLSPHDTSYMEVLFACCEFSSLDKTCFFVLCSGPYFTFSSAFRFLCLRK